MKNSTPRLHDPSYSYLPPQLDMDSQRIRGDVSGETHQERRRLNAQSTTCSARWKLTVKYIYRRDKNMQFAAGSSFSCIADTINWGHSCASFFPPWWTYKNIYLILLEYLKSMVWSQNQRAGVLPNFIILRMQLVVISIEQIYSKNYTLFVSFLKKK